MTKREAVLKEGLGLLMYVNVSNIESTRDDKIVELLYWSMNPTFDIITKSISYSPKANTRWLEPGEEVERICGGFGFVTNFYYLTNKSGLIDSLLDWLGIVKK